MGIKSIPSAELVIPKSWSDGDEQVLIPQRVSYPILESFVLPDRLRSCVTVVILSVAERAC